MAVTSQLHPAATLGELLVQHWQAAGLLKPSLIKPVITTLEHSLLIKTLGRLHEQDRIALKRTIDLILA